jgi:mRNA interferase MazF
MDSIKKGDIYLVNFDPTVGVEVQKTRPAVIVSNDINNLNSPIFSISPITSSVTKVYSFEVLVSKNLGGLSKKSKIMINQTRAVDKIRLIKILGTLPDTIMQKVNTALILHYNLG